MSMIVCQYVIMSICQWADAGAIADLGDDFTTSVFGRGCYIINIVAGLLTSIFGRGDAIVDLGDC